MEDNFKNTVIDLFKKKKWKEILQLNESSTNKYATKLLWVWPSVDNLNFIKSVLVENHLKGITSIGCGCGLLEWIIREHSGMQVTGLEVNEEWWNSRYSNPQFIKLHFPEFPLKENFCKETALFFCYFNDRGAFIDYVDHYEGNVVIIIGPGEGRGTLTNPEPFSADFGRNTWKLDRYQEVKDTKDFIAVYIKN